MTAELDNDKTYKLHGKTYEVLNYEDDSTKTIKSIRLTDPGKYMIGRKCTMPNIPEKIELPADETETSRAHAQLELSANGNLYIIDLNSTNGTYVVFGEHLVKVPREVGRPVQDGEIFKFGKKAPFYEFRKSGETGWIFRKYEPSDMTETGQRTEKR